MEPLCRNLLVSYSSPRGGWAVELRAVNQCRRRVYAILGGLDSYHSTLYLYLQAICNSLKQKGPAIVGLQLQAEVGCPRPPRADPKGRLALSKEAWLIRNSARFWTFVEVGRSGFRHKIVAGSRKVKGARLSGHTPQRRREERDQGQRRQ